MVVIKSAIADQILILVPFPVLEKEYDQEGLYIKFTYRKLRMPLPEGCETAVMAELKSVEKSN